MAAAVEQVLSWWQLLFLFLAIKFNIDIRTKDRSHPILSGLAGAHCDLSHTLSGRAGAHCNTSSLHLLRGRDLGSEQVRIPISLALLAFWLA